MTTIAIPKLISIADSSKGSNVFWSRQISEYLLGEEDGSGWDYGNEMGGVGTVE